MEGKLGQTFKSALEHALKKVEKNLDELKNSFPFITVNGKWEMCDEKDWGLNIFSNGYWCNGFWIGMLWRAFKVTIHDLGFLFYPSFCVGYDITKDNYRKSAALTAADSLLSRFNDKIGAITVSGGSKKSGLTAIDTMMNLPLLWWAYEKARNAGYYDAAYKHALTTMQHFVREDGSTYHIIEFDPESGQVRRKATWQGYDDESCWSRGQAWAIYGFALAYKYTKEELFLITAEKLADHYIANCPSDYVPYWDFNDPDIPHTVKDSSAAAITSSGLLDLSDVDPDKTKAKEYKKVAYILNNLSKNHIADNSSHGILLHGCFDKPKNIAIDSSLILGDYYYLEALTRLVGDG